MAGPGLHAASPLFAQDFGPSIQQPHEARIDS